MRDISPKGSKKTSVIQTPSIQIENFRHYPKKTANVYELYLEGSFINDMF